MRNADLDEIRALLRAQAVAAPEPARKSLLDGMKSLLTRPTPVRSQPLNLSPVAQRPAPLETPVVEATPLDLDAPAPVVAASDDAPMLFLAPRRHRFGLAEEGARLASPEPRPALKLKPVLETPDEFEPRRRGGSLAATEAAGVGQEEIVELHELLSARMPSLLEQVDLDAKLAEAKAAEQAAAASEVRAACTEAADAADGWAVSAAALDLVRHGDLTLADQPRLKLVRLEADLGAAQADAHKALAKVRRSRKKRALAA